MESIFPLIATLNFGAGDNFVLGNTAGESRFFSIFDMPTTYFICAIYVKIRLDDPFFLTFMP